jgi:hypothetical protein
MEYKGFSMCSGEEGKVFCPIRNQCYRFQLHKEEKSKEFGYYYISPEYKEETEDCEFKIEKRNEKI